MPTYHINPATGNPNVCRARVDNCPYGQAGSPHYASQQEARAGYEELMNDGKGSWAKRLMEERYRLHMALCASDLKDFEKLIPSIEKRKALDEKISQAVKQPSLTPLLPSLKEAPPFATETFPAGEVREGFANSLEELQKRPTLGAALEEASFAWIGSLTGDELEAVRDYTSDSAGYGAAHEDFPSLHRALHKAPSFPPVTLYSGASHEMRELVLEQAPSGRIVIPRAISTSCNPAQVNGFMAGFAPGSIEARQHVALEIETTKAASLIGISHSPHEFELLLPPGTYEVVGEEENVLYSWGPDEKTGKPFGRKADKTFKLRQLVEA